MNQIKFHFGARQLNTLTIDRDAVKTDANIPQFLTILMCPTVIWQAIIETDTVKQVSLFTDTGDLMPYLNSNNQIVRLDTTNPDFEVLLRELLTSHSAISINGKSVSVLSLDEALAD